MINSFAKNNYSEVTNSFLEVLIESGRLGDLDKIISTYINYCKILNKEQDIKIISAKTLTPEEKTQVVESVKRNKPDIKFKVTYEVDANILGGLQVYAGS